MRIEEHKRAIKVLEKMGETAEIKQRLKEIKALEKKLS
jgi:hypothetical protein